MLRHILKVGPTDFTPRLVVFDKDGTIIDFNHMWGLWVTGLGTRLDSLLDLAVSIRLFNSFGLDPVSGRVSPDGPLAVWSMAALADLAVQTLCEVGLERKAAEVTIRSVWYAPDPVRLARPLADLPRIFFALQTAGVKTAVATSDDRAPTFATLAHLGIEQYMTAVVAANDGLPTKPAPDMIFQLCGVLGLAPSETVVVGDAVDDLIMGHAAGAGLVVGVLSGVSRAEVLAPHADVLVPSVGELV